MAAGLPAMAADQAMQGFRASSLASQLPQGVVANTGLPAMAVDQATRGSKASSLASQLLQGVVANTGLADDTNLL
ncbi:hypothetical protein CCU68_26535 [Pseudomonas gingeri NCPPB 3146 = LMG 5327]|uniref:Uncharacterized protein n=1 Tax=Pseudomonas gingeri NCPPB 3146 = LMG 5327 TaxID=707248 RepID=A0ABX4XX48_9PSED|nr:hypothetical protein CCU68_26535 [Pseudomonas gingeri NCPPB 3146 = LMG 5327]